MVEEAKLSIGLEKMTPMMSDLMFRLYKIRQDCGIIETPEQKAAREKDEQEAIKNLKKMDDFERRKAEVVQILDRCKELIDAWDTKGSLDQRDKAELMRKINEVPDYVDHLKAKQAEAKNRDGIWKKLTIKKVPENIMNQREKDLNDIELYYKRVTKLYQKKIRPGASKSDDTPKHNIQFDSIDNLKDASEEDANKIPVIDISEGLRQIDEKKKEVYKLLDHIDSQLDQMKEIAKGYKDELKLQLEMLDKIEKDVEKYTESLGKLNGQLDVLISKVGGPTKLLIIIIILIFVIVAIIVGYFLLTNFLRI